MKRFTKTLCAVLAILALTMLAACSGGGGGNTERDNKVKLSFMHYWPEHKAVFTKIIQDYMAENQNVEINPTSVDFSSMESALQSAAQGGTIPDVFGYWSDKIANFVYDKVPLDLKPYLTEEWRAEFAENGASWDAGSVNGGYYAAPFRVTGFSIIYNATMFEQYGWEVPSTLEELETLLVRIKTAGLIPLSAYGKTGGTIYHLYDAFSVYANYLMGKCDDPNYKTGRLRATEADFEIEAKIVDKFKSWLSANLFGANPEGKSRESVIQEFTQFKAPMCLFNNNELYLLEEEMKGTKLGSFAIPGPAGCDATYIFGTFDSFCVSNSSKNKEEAVKFLKYLLSDEVQQYFANETLSVSLKKNVTYESEMQQHLADSIKGLGKYNMFPDYKGTDSASENYTLRLNYLNGQSALTALELVKKMNENTGEDIRDDLLNPQGLDWIEPTFTRKSFDQSWLSPLNA